MTTLSSTSWPHLSATLGRGLLLHLLLRLLHSSFLTFHPPLGFFPSPHFPSSHLHPVCHSFTALLPLRPPSSRPPLLPSLQILYLRSLLYNLLVLISDSYLASSFLFSSFTPSSTFTSWTSPHFHLLLLYLLHLVHLSSRPVFTFPSSSSLPHLLLTLPLTLPCHSFLFSTFTSCISSITSASSLNAHRRLYLGLSTRVGLRRRCVTLSVTLSAKCRLMSTSVDAYCRVDFRWDLCARGEWSI